MPGGGNRYPARPYPEDDQEGHRALLNVARDRNPRALLPAAVGVPGMTILLFPIHLGQVLPALAGVAGPSRLRSDLAESPARVESLRSYLFLNIPENQTGSRRGERDDN